VGPTGVDGEGLMMGEVTQCHAMHADKPCKDPLIDRLCPEPHVEGLAELGPAELVLSVPSAPDGCARLDAAWRLRETAPRRRTPQQRGSPSAEVDQQAEVPHA
jgi:hypothetical protein